MSHGHRRVRLSLGFSLAASLVAVVLRCRPVRPDPAGALVAGVGLVTAAVVGRRFLAGVGSDCVEGAVTLGAVTWMGVGEELAYRGVVLELVRRRLGVPAAVAVSALAFALAHAGRGRRSVLYNGGAGVVFGLLQVLSGGWLSPSLFHVAHNLGVLQATLADRAPAADGPLLAGGR